MGTVTGAQFIKTNELENKSRPCTTMHCINDDCSCDVGLYVIPFGTPEFLKMTPGWKKNWNLVSDQRSLCCNWSCYAVSHPPETYSFLFLVLKNLIQLLSSHWFKIIYFYITFSKESFFRYFLFPLLNMLGIEGRQWSEVNDRALEWKETMHTEPSLLDLQFRKLMSREFKCLTTSIHICESNTRNQVF